MSGSEIVYPPPVVEVFLKALILAENEEAPEIAVDHLLAALNSPTPEREPVEQSTRPFAPAPHRDKALSSEAQKAIAKAGGLGPADLEQLTIDSLRTALLATKRDRTK